MSDFRHIIQTSIAVWLCSALACTSSQERILPQADKLDGSDYELHEADAEESSSVPKEMQQPEIGVSKKSSRSMAPKSMRSKTQGLSIMSDSVAAMPEGYAVPAPAPQPNTEDYAFFDENDFKQVSQDPLSTFSSDVDTASYAILRRFLQQGQLPPKDAVRIEEMVNYFDYEYALPTNKEPVSAHIESAAAPWNAKHRLVKIGVKAKEFSWTRRPALNLVFLVDVSGSMSSPDKLPLLKKSFEMLTNKLGPKDRVAMVAYAGASGLVLGSTSGNKKVEIISALHRLQAGGSTNGGSGIQLAYSVAQQNFIKRGVNRVILATDGDFNVGVSSRGDLVRLVQEKAKSGVYLSVLGFGMGNYKDSTLEQIAGKGNGNYAYIDSAAEAKKVLDEQIAGTLITVAKDLKLQVEFNPAVVTAYRLIGYENRVMAHKDFNNDRKDAGDVGAGHRVTALYEVVPRGVAFAGASVDELKYQSRKKDQKRPLSVDPSAEMLTLKIRYKKPSGTKSAKQSYAFTDKGSAFAQASQDFRFAAAVAGFGMLLRGSTHAGDLSFSSLHKIAKQSSGSDKNGRRSEMIRLIEAAQRVSNPGVDLHAHVD